MQSEVNSDKSMSRPWLAAVLLVLMGATLPSVPGCAPNLPSPGKFPEELIYARSEDDIVNGGVLFSPPQDLAKPVVVIWIHGWGVNFYHPTYVGTGRALAERGYSCISANTRMHDIGNVAGYRWGRRIRGGGYWGVASEEVRDLAAWIDLAERLGFKQVVLVGHSAGWAAVRLYQFETQDPRVIGMVLASGMVWAEREPTDPELLAQAKRLVEEGRGDDLLRLPNRSFPSFVSAATFLDIHNTPPELYDFFGVETPNPGVTRTRCPILAFFGTDGDVGGEKDLELLESSIRRQTSDPSRVETVMIEGADHMYAAEEPQVAQTIATWADSLLRPD
jgi:pimeloyl-ACP methyl ester carboxylesterase